jgi:hypothetical protein
VNARLSNLSPGAAVLIGALAFAVGIAINVDNAKFFAHGIELIMPEGALRDTRIEAGYLMVIAELLFFFLAAMVRGPGSAGWRTAFTAMALALAVFETVTIYSTQAAIGRAGVAEVTGTDSRIEQLQASITQQRETARALRASGERSAASDYRDSRIAGMQAIDRAAALEARTAQLSAELGTLHASRRPTMESILGEDGAQAHNAAFSILLMLSGMLLTSSAGWFVGNARMGWAARKLGDAGRWARDGAAKVAMPAAAAGVVAMSPAAFAAPAPASPAPQSLTAAAPSPSTIRYSVPLATVPAMLDRAHADTADRARTSTPAPTERVDVDTVQPPPASAKASRSQRRAPRATRVEDGQKLDTGTEGKAAARYQRVRAAVASGQVKPSVRAIQSAEGGGTVVVRRYLQTMADEGLIERKPSGQGYVLLRRPVHPDQIELTL